ncbi:MAG: aminotransferase class III-fold pyridoxal phosphate-dependent enzyme, partial [Rhodothermales bacterium]|nr:aminotransferase class III-fold pyridoxal phosphate-dependent enzyme [Rhodothermales bacterium]
GPGPERQRTIHLGVDLFAPAGTTVHTPYDARVVSVRDNDALLDYGPTVILEHQANGQPFWTLYGHLGRGVMALLEPGQELQAGDLVGELGHEAENGGWPPHLHFQVYADDLDSAGNLPGVAFASQLEVWRSLSPNPDLILRTGLPLTYSPADPEAIVAARQDRLSPSLSLSYSEPLHIVRGIGPWLFDVNGRAWLDGVNNVCHLGHTHPAVVRAVSRQISVLNTNTRYLHDNIVRYADELTGTLPDGLDVCFFVNSGSEANDLALRLARTATGRRGTIVLDGGYHGNLSSLVEISSYKFDGPGGAGPLDSVAKAPSPDAYRSTGATGQDFACGVERAARDLADRGVPAAAFIAESILSCGGQVEPPAGYLPAAYAHARKAGALCIADEVQTGFGRVGHAMWSFELQGVVPDIVTMGKPIGNGFPLGAVVTTRAIAEAFANGMEYFNTYGGNPVSCAAGLAVLKTIRDEGLQDHAREVGDHLKRGLQDLADRYPLIGDVRGQGLFLGVEFVKDRATLEPAAEEASWIVNRMKSLGVLLSTDGPLHNVIKIKPPLAFSRAHADEMLQKLDLVLQDTCLNP